MSRKYEFPQIKRKRIRYPDQPESERSFRTSSESPNRNWSDSESPNRRNWSDAESPHRNRTSSESPHRSRSRSYRKRTNPHRDRSSSESPNRNRITSALPPRNRTNRSSNSSESPRRSRKNAALSHQNRRSAAYRPQNRKNLALPHRDGFVSAPLHRSGFISAPPHLPRCDANFRGEIAYSSDASPLEMQFRRRALALSKFSFLDAQTARPIAEEETFQLERCGKRPFKELAGIRYNVAWISENDVDIRVDRGVKLYDLESVRGHDRQGLSEGPKSPWFGLVDPRRLETHDQRVHLDANLFWSVGFYFKYLKTCGVRTWDAELREMIVNQTWAAPVREERVFRLGQRYTGCVVDWDWEAGQGSLECTLVPGLVNLDERDLVGGGGFGIIENPVGTSVNFELRMTGNRFRAIKAKPYV